MGRIWTHIHSMPGEQFQTLFENYEFHSFDAENVDHIVESNTKPQNENAWVQYIWIWLHSPVQQSKLINAQFQSTVRTFR